MKELYDVGIRLDQRKPIVKIIKKPRGGLSINSTVKLAKVGYETLAAILKEFKIMNADVVIRDDIDIDQFIDAIEGNRKYVHSLTCVTKADLLNDKELQELKERLPNAIFVSAEKNKGLDELKERIFNSLNFVRIFLKEVNQKPDLDEPMILTRPTTLKTVCERIHRDFVKKFKYARVWGKSAKFPGQIFRNLEKLLEDGDIVEVHVR